MASKITTVPLGSGRLSVLYDGESIGEVKSHPDGWSAYAPSGFEIIPVIGNPRWLTRGGAELALINFRFS